jgi:4,5-dihydroxyphthalate decarboxylase
MSEPVTMAIQRFDRTAALHTGAVPVKGVTVLHVPAGLVGVDGVLKGIFDAAEMPLAHYVFLKDQGEPFTAIPVFPDRLFIQQYVYTRPDTGIRSPADLRGRRVLIPLYYMTASFWHRAFLEEDHGIRPEEIDWYTTSTERDPRMRIPDGVRVTHRAGPHFGFERLLDGTVDALLTEATPVLDDAARARLVRVHRDADRLQREFWARTGVHIIVHLIVIRQAAVWARPSLPEELCEAFDQAKAIAYRTLEDDRMTSLPLIRSYLDETVKMFGDDPWPYGVERNRSALGRFLGYAHQQGYTRQRLTPESLFDNPSRDFPFRARMASWLA